MASVGTTEFYSMSPDLFLGLGTRLLRGMAAGAMLLVTLARLHHVVQTTHVFMLCCPTQIVLCAILLSLTCYMVCIN